MPIGYASHKIVLDTDGHPIDYVFLDVNIAFEQFTGLHRADILNRRVGDVMPQLLRDEFDWVKFYGNIALNGGSLQFEQFSAPLNKWYRVNVTSPQLYYFITYFTDISHEVAELNEHKALLTALNDAVMEISEDFVFTNVIAPQNNVLFFPEKKISGKKIDEVLPPNSVSELMEICHKTKVSQQVETLEYQSPIPNDIRWFRADVKYVTIGRQPKYIMNITDISQQKKYEFKMLQQAEELDRFFSVNLDLLCITDDQYRFLKVNKSWETTLGYAMDTLINRCFLDLVHPDDLSATIDVKTKLDNQIVIFNFVNRMRAKDGSYRYIEWRLHPYGHIVYAAARDVTHWQQMEETLYMEKERFQTTLMSIGDGVIAVDANERITFMNAMAQKLSGWSQEEITGLPFRNFFTIINEITGKRINPITQVLKSQTIAELENNIALIKKGCTLMAIEESAAPIRDKNGHIQGVVLVFRDVTEKKRIRNEIEYLSFHDYLTGLYNRRFFEEELLRLDNVKHLPLSVIMIDVNGLKLTNDAFGHQTGDALLKKAAEIIVSACPSGQLVARTGGDEFSVILRKTSSEQAHRICKNIQKKAASETLNSVIISVAVGHDTKELPSQDIYDIVRSAENYMYRDKIRTSRSMRSKTLDLIIQTLNKSYHTEQKHTENVRQLCRQIGQALHMTAEDCKRLELAGFLHDIGKIVVPTEILNKPHMLTKEESEIMQRHCEAGYQILKSVEEYSSIAEYVLCHHERWDGDGYPRKLKGENIPLITRIVTVADAFETMTSGRPYRKPLSREQAVLELESNAGTQFDPHIVQVFVDKVLPALDDTAHLSL